jgi:uncharacterized protein (TIGR03382 family)
VLPLLEEQEGAAGGGGKTIRTTEGCSAAGPIGASSPFAMFGVALGLALLLSRRRR